MLLVVVVLLVVDAEEDVVFLRLEEGAGAGAPSCGGGRFLQDLWRVPGLLSGPLRLGTASYSHWLLLRAQLLHPGRVESHRILRARHWRQAMTILDVSFLRWSPLVGDDGCCVVLVECSAEGR